MCLWGKTQRVRGVPYKNPATYRLDPSEKQKSAARV
jgi:hypothetical protein